MPDYRLRIVSLLPENRDLGLPKNLITLEHRSIDLDKADRSVVQGLREITAEDAGPVDAYIVEKRHLKRLKKLARNARFVCPENVLPIENLAD